VAAQSLHAISREGRRSVHSGRVCKPQSERATSLRMACQPIYSIRAKGLSDALHSQHTKSTSSSAANASAFVQVISLGSAKVRLGRSRGKSNGQVEKRNVGNWKVCVEPKTHRQAYISVSPTAADGGWSKSPYMLQGRKSNSSPMVVNRRVWPKSRK